MNSTQIVNIISASSELTELANAGEWSSIISEWPEQLLPSEKAGPLATSRALGENYPVISAEFDKTVMGRDLKSIMFSDSGIDWSMPDTIMVLGLLKNEVITQDVINTLVGVSKRTEGKPSADQIQEAWQRHIEVEPLTADEVRHEVLLSCNRGTDGVLRVVARVTPVEFADGVLLRRGDATVVANNAALIAALTPIVEGLI